MRLSLQTQTLEYVAVIRCEGRIVSGDEIQALQHEVDNSLLAKKRIVLNMAHVDFIDSAGLGFLVRIFSRLQNEGGGLKLCELSPAMVKALRITNLHAVMPSYESEHLAVGAFARLQEWQQKSPGKPITRVVCVDDSYNVLAYLNALLTQAGYEVFPTRHLNEARTLANIVRPRVLILGPSGQANDSLVQRIRQTAPDLQIIALPQDFSTDEASHSGMHLIHEVGSVVNR